MNITEREQRVAFLKERLGQTGLTERERWLMDRAWMVCAENHAYSRGADDTAYMNCAEWLDDLAAGGVTVEERLAKDAPKPPKPIDPLELQATWAHLKREQEALEEARKGQKS